MFEVLATHFELSKLAVRIASYIQLNYDIVGDICTGKQRVVHMVMLKTRIVETATMGHRPWTGRRLIPYFPFDNSLYVLRQVIL